MNLQLTDGNRWTATAPYTMTKGQCSLIGTGAFGIAADAIASGASGLFIVERMAFTTSEVTAAETWANGAPLYWDPATRKLTNVAGSLRRVGMAYGAKAVNATSADVWMDGKAL